VSKWSLGIVSLCAVVALFLYAVLPNVPKCSCHYEWINGALYIVCC